MKNQPNDIVALGSLLPLSKEQLSQLLQGWQSGTDATAEQITQCYQMVSLSLIEASLPHYLSTTATTVTESLGPKHYKQLLVGWRQQLQQLLDSNTNQPTVITALKKACHYLAQDVDHSQDSHKQLCLWYLAELWLRNLVHNQSPLPMDYIQLLSYLDQVIESHYQQTLAQQDSNHKEPVDDLEDGIIDRLIDKLIVQVYINIGKLAQVDDTTRQLMDELSTKIASDANCSNPTSYHEMDEVVGYDDAGEVVSTTWQMAQAQVLPDIFDMDEEIREIFIEEALESAVALTRSIADWQQDIQNLIPLKEIHRNFYTLKGSGRMIGALSISETAWAVENLLIHVLDKSLPITDDVAALVLQAVEQLPTFIEDFRLSQRPRFDPAVMILQSNNLLAGLPPLYGIRDKGGAKKIKNSVVLSSQSDSPFNQTVIANSYLEAFNDATEITTTLDEMESSSDTSINLNIPAVLLSFVEKATQMPTDTDNVDPDIREIFIEEAHEVLEEIEPLYRNWQLEIADTASLTDVRRGFHTLKGSGRMVGAHYSAELAWAIESMLNRILDKSLMPSTDMKQLVADVLAAYPNIIDTFAKGRHDYPIAVLLWVAVANAYSQQLGDSFDYRELYREWMAKSGIDDNVEIDSVDTSANERKNLVELSNRSDLSFEKPAITNSHLEFSYNTHNANDSDISTPLNEPQSGNTSINLLIPAVLLSFVEKATQMPTDTDNVDPDIREIFIEEAHEVLEEIEPLYRNWQLEIADTASLTDVRRGFHTLKGSGRMVGAHYSAELAWAIESMLNRILDKSLMPSTDMKQLVADVLAAYPNIIDTFAKGRKDYPAIVLLWAAAAHAYSQQLGDSFDYRELYREWMAKSGVDDSINERCDDSIDGNNDHSIEVDSAEDMLQTIYSINDMMSDTSMAVAAQNSEEREIFDIFIEEAKELLQQVDDFVSEHQNENHVQVSDEIVRAFHTLRAASGTNALAAISEVSATIEQRLEHLQKHDTPLSAQHIEALTQSVALIRGYLDTYEQNVQQQSVAPTTQSKQDVESLQAMLDNSEESGIPSDNELSISQLLDLEIDALLDAEWQLADEFAERDLESLQAYIEQILQQILRLAKNTLESSKFAPILTALEMAYSYLYEHPKGANDSHIQDALIAAHTHLVNLFDSLAGRISFKVNQQLLDDLQAAISRHSQHTTNESDNDGRYEDETDTSEALLSMVAESNELVIVESAFVEELQLEIVNTDIELLEIFLEEAQELDGTIVKAFNQWRHEVDNVSTLKVLQRHLHTIKGGARMAGIRSIGDLTHAAESIYESFINNKIKVTLQWIDVMQIIQDTLSLQLEYVVRHQQSFWTHDLIEQLGELELQSQLPSKVTLKLPILKDFTALHSTNKDSQKLSEKSSIASLDVLTCESWTDGLPDADILEVFLEEAEELVENSQKYLQLFLNNTSDVAAVQTLQRDLHTIKGGARMVGADGIADLAHQMESLYEALSIGRRPANNKIAELLIGCHEWLTDAVFVLKHRVNPMMPSTLITALQDLSKNTDSSQPIAADSLQEQISVILAVQAEQRAVSGDIDISQMPAMTGSFAEPERSIDNNEEMIRISGSLVEHMINLSGESAINRARIDMGMSSLTGSIGEMNVTVQRLADQLRRMEIELEAQILSQIDEDLIKSEDFDPLEMDQYSSLNQLSKSLTESASDLIDINNTLLEKTRDNENLLLQLSRTQTELQDGLMNSRMVPFLRLKPRLDLIVRQTANELGKSVDLTIITADDELDRTILERITSPLEHMLRNAVDHGIESSQERLAKGKDRSGHITLEVLREGSEVVIHLSDDGRGIDINEVREKAISQGLINPEEYQYTDLEVMQYVFNAGVTTSKQVTQISGRGVGMDVVASEIRQLGGGVSVSSDTGIGTRFTMRIPLTVAVSDALVVRVADRYYAIPLIQIERVVRVNPEALYDYYHSTAATMQIEGKDYRVRYLNNLITGSKFNELMMNTNTSLPVIIVKNSSGQNLALQVDQIEGSRIEVVVKPMGQQLSHLAGISAATIMGNGSVMLILDIIALLRQSTLKTVTPIETIEPPTRRSAERKPTILVVDDSVTVRKVTSRFLERQGLNAIVAKDGIDAMEILQELTPDLMLLDIEMPRMDGFEVATQVRNNQRLQQIPIIMITSRTGDKHRTRAFETGVDDYMGKPFQENELLEKIQALLDIKIEAYQKA